MSDSSDFLPKMGVEMKRVEEGEGNMEMGRPRILAAWFVWFIHMMLMMWMIGGSFLPYVWAWWSIVILVPFLEIHWATNDNRCILSDLEVTLRGPDSGREIGDGVFIRNVVEKVFRIQPSDRFLNGTIHVIMIVVGLVSLGRIIISK